MCGIAGSYGTKLPSLKSIKESSKFMQNRGPDARGECILKTDNLALIHRRLSIIDLDKRSNQPMKFKNSVLVFNGEIYNFIEIRKTLKKLGHIFITNSDTEVLIHALKEWQEHAVNYLEGMWAFAWYDIELKKLILSRDRFGEKPLYFYKNKKNFFFSSEIKSLSAISSKKFKINYDKIDEFLKNGYKSVFKDEYLFFKDVFQINPGTSVVINKNLSIKKINYWSPKFKEKKNIKTYNKIVKINKKNLQNSVKLRMRSDVPIGFCMSSGVDSNGLISIAKKNYNQKIIAYNIYSKDKNYDEYDLTKKSAGKLKIKLKLVKPPQKNFLKNLKNIIQKRGYPLFTISYFLHWYMVKEMKKDGIKVAISGSGADEIYSGYIDHFNQYMYQIRNLKSLFKKSKLEWEKYFKKYIRNERLKECNLYFNNKNSREHIFYKFPKDIFQKKINGKFKEKKFVNNLLRNRMLNELFHEIVPTLLHEDDMNSMNFSIENRTPYLDTKIFQFSQQIPTKYLVRNGYLKAVLRDSLKNIAPIEILSNRQKMGFNASIYDYLNLKSKSFRLIINSKSNIFKLVKRKKFYDYILKNKSAESSKLIFRFLSVKFFLDQNS